MTRTKSPIKRDAILTAAKVVFFEHGYSCASVDKIAAVANVSKATIYKHFQDKHALFQAIIHAHAEKLHEAVKLTVNYSASIEVGLAQVAERILDFLLSDDNIAFFRLIIAESGRLPDIGHALYVDGELPISSVLINYIEQQKQLAITDSFQAAKAFLGLIKEGCFWHVMLGLAEKPSTKERQQAIAEAVDIWLAYYRR